MKTEFKGTMGKWLLNEKYQTIEDSEGYGIAQQNGIKNSEKWLNDALLISKAPELLESFISAIILLKQTTEFEVLDSYKEKVLEFEKLLEETLT
jgi:hypothetical protein